MAGIHHTYLKKANGMDIGQVLAMGEMELHGKKAKYLIIMFDDDMGIEVEIDYGADLRFQEGIKVNDRVKLTIIDEYSAEWQKEE